MAKSRNRRKTKAQIKVSENQVEMEVENQVENYTNCLGYNEHIAIIEEEEDIEVEEKFQVIQDYEKTKNQVQKLEVANEL